MTAALALGSNLGDRRAHIEHAFQALDSLPGTRVTARSSVIETEPLGPAGQQNYLNAAALVQTSLPARVLLDAMLVIESSRGRVRPDAVRWGPRTLDLDLLLYADDRIDEPGLVIPHPRLAERLFVLIPLAEIAPAVAVPGRARTVSDLLAALQADRG